MQYGPIQLILLAGLCCLCAPAWALKPTVQEMSEARGWAATHLERPRDAAALPFSFTHGGKPSRGLVGTWKAEQNSTKLDKMRVRRTATLTDAATGLVVRCEAVEYQDFPTVEWIVHFKNTGTQDTPILTNIQPLDVGFKRIQQEEFVLHHHSGGHSGRDDYQPFETALGPKSSFEMKSDGKSSLGAWPYFNVEWDGGGVGAAGLSDKKKLISIWGATKILNSLTQDYARTRNPESKALARKVMLALKKLARWEPNGQCWFVCGEAMMNADGTAAKSSWNRLPAPIVEPLVNYWRATGEKEALDFARAYADGIIGHAQPDGIEFNKDGSFVGHSYGIGAMGLCAQPPSDLQVARQHGCGSRSSREGYASVHGTGSRPPAGSGWERPRLGTDPSDAGSLPGLSAQAGPCRIIVVARRGLTLLAFGGRLGLLGGSNTILLRLLDWLPRLSI